MHIRRYRGADGDRKRILHTRILYRFAAGARECDDYKLSDDDMGYRGVQTIRAAHDCESMTYKSTVGRADFYAF